MGRITALAAALFGLGALGATALLLAPVRGSYGFAKIGGSLAPGTQRDVRVFNNFQDGAANNNLAFEPRFPGWVGAEQALWKAASEWGSGPHGDGGGDPTQTTLGDGLGNFDFFFSGGADGAGGSNRNIISTIPNCGGGTLAYVQSPIADGWTMKFCEEWTWSDGPGQPGGNRIDIQGVGTHELGHSLGLGHSLVSGATMVGSISGNGISARSIADDDINGLQCVYGPVSATKVTITAVAVDLLQDTVTIDGFNFSDTGNEVWFTRAALSNPGVDPQIRVTGVDATSGGTHIVVSIPPDAGSGDVAVKSTATGHDSLSNSWPLDVLGGTNPLSIHLLTPSPIPALLPGTSQSVTILGTGFDATVTLAIDGTSLAPGSYTVGGESSITLDMPQLAALGLHTLTIQKGTELADETIELVAPSAPVVQAGTGDPANPVTGSVPILLAGPVGELEYVVWSLSNLPSAFPPYGSLEIGDNFTGLCSLGTFVIPAAGWTGQVFPLLPGNLVVYVQAVTLDQGLPVVTSNVSSFQMF